MSVRLCAPPYYLYTLREWLRYIEPLLEELGVPLRVEVVGECGDVFIEICGTWLRGLPDSEGALLELILSQCGAGPPRGGESP